MFADAKKRMGFADEASYIAALARTYRPEAAEVRQSQFERLATTRI
jgi:hypothetical protein